MRVIAGSARSLPLKTPAGLETRPTTDRIKETLFNMIQSGLYGCRFLDLYSGSGAIGIEALSRGAQKAVFVEQQKKALSCIRENLAFTHLDGVVMGSSVEAALPRLEAAKESFDYVFMDPPYGKEEERRVLEYLSHSELIQEDSTIIVEADLTTDFSYLRSLGFYIEKQKRYKTNQYVFIKKLKE